MNKVDATAVSYRTNLTFSFSNTARGENVNLYDYSSFSFIIDVNGTVYQGSPATETNATVCIIGGLNKFVHSRINTIHSNFYLTVQQKITLYKIMKDLASFTDSATISSDNDKLEQALTTLYSNYCA